MLTELGTAPWVKEKHARLLQVLGWLEAAEPNTEASKKTLDPTPSSKSLGTKNLQHPIDQRRRPSPNSPENSTDPQIALGFRV